MNWQQVFDFTRRQGAGSVQVSQSDILIICQLVSSRIWTAHPWQFTLTTTAGIPAVNGQQNYPMPSDCYRLVKAWLRYPQPVVGSSNTVPPFDDPAYLAYQAALASQTYVQGQDLKIDSPAFFFYPLDVVKTLDNNLYPNTAQKIHQITQIGNSGEWRLSQATYVPADQPFELFGQYQPFSPKIIDLGKLLWMPDNYSNLAEAGILYYLYKANNDPRAGAASFQNGRMVYSGQLAVWMGEIEMAAEQEREGSVDTFSPEDSLGSNLAAQGIWIPYWRKYVSNGNGKCGISCRWN
jgi:hypothetical protein